MMTSFVEALRAADVQVSPAETLEAMQAADLVGFGNRALLKDTLSLSMAKTPEEKAFFDETFDRFFSFETMENAAGAADGDVNEQSAVDEDAGEGDEASQDDNNLQNDGEQGEGSPSGGPPSGMGGGKPSDEGEPGDDGVPSQSLMEMLRSGDRNALSMAIARAGEEVGIRNIRFFTQRGLYGRRIMERIGLQELTDEIIAAERAEGVGGPRVEALKGVREMLRQDVDNYVERNLALYAQHEGKRLREEVLESVRLTNVEMRDFAMMQQLVRKMSKKLVALHSRRRRKARRGHLDVRRTIRHNVAYDGMMFDTHWKRRKVDRPDVMAICDVSGSVSTVARFLLMFLYSLGEVLPKVRSFAFSGHLGEVTELFETMDMEQAIPLILREYGGGSTDYGVALQDFADIALGDIDNRTTVIVLGDGRSNHVDPRADIMKLIYERARRVIFLNPEPEGLWGTGDSEMLKLKPFSHRAQMCGSLKDLERVVDDILRTAT
ncbi:VWA domain-containing protein [Pyruvatibacter sp.]|uniref:VWA domain-containing protein n=1 Tax=Pyruvatibacter sp. TaxID=1981328 RepID=UPI0032EF1266